jgi:hypothetical protein
MNEHELAEKNKIVLMVGHTFEYNSAVHTLRDYIVNGKLGKIYYIYSQRLNLGKIRNDVNAMWNLAIHDISILLYVLKLKPVSVSAKGISYVQPNIEDVVCANEAFLSNHIITRLKIIRIAILTELFSIALLIFNPNRLTKKTKTPPRPMISTDLPTKFRKKDSANPVLTM